MKYRSIKVIATLLTALALLSCPTANIGEGDVGEKIDRVPKNLKLTDKWIDALRFTWSSVKESEHYFIYRCDTVDGEYIKIAQTSTMHYKDDGTNYLQEAATTAKPAKNRRYFYKVSSFKSDKGESELSLPLEAMTAIDSPYDFVIDSKGKNNITLKWQAVAAATAYRIYRDKGLDMGHEQVVTIPIEALNGKFEFTDYNLVEGYNYYYRIQALTAETESRLSDSLYVAMDINIPDNLKAVWSDAHSAVLLSWNKVTNPDNPIHGYKLYRSDSSPEGPYTEIANIDGAHRTTHQDRLNNSSIIHGKSIYYKIASFYYGVPNTRSQHVETATKPQDPKNLKVVGSTDKTLKIQWESPTYATGVKIYRMTGTQKAADVTPVLQQGLSKNYFLDENLEPNKKYRYQIRFYIDLGNGDPHLDSKLSNEASDYTLPASCTELTLTKDSINGVHSVTITWPFVLGASEYILDFKKSTSTGGYERLHVQPKANQAKYTFQHDNLESLTGYVYRVTVKAVNDNVVKYSAPTISSPIVTNPDCPLDLIAKATGAGTVEVSWTAIPTIPDNYTLKYKIYRVGKTDPIGTVDSPAVIFTDNVGLNSNSSYTYKVKTYVEPPTGQPEESIFSNEDSALTYPAMPTLTAPRKEVTSNTVELNIEAADGADSFDIYLSTDGQMPQSAVATNFSDNSAVNNIHLYNSSSLADFTKYTYFVVAKNSAGSSEAAKLEVTTRPEAPLTLTFTDLTSDGVKVNWSAINNMDPQEYDIVYLLKRTKKGESNFSTLEAGSNLFFTDSNLSSNTTYSYELYAKITHKVSGVEVYSSSITKEVLTCPAKPTITFSNHSTTGVTIDVNSTGDTTGLTYDLGFKKSDAANLTQLLTGSTNAQHIQASGLAAFTEYIYSAKSKNSSGTATSAETTYVTIPAAPGALELTPSTTEQRIDLSWTAGVNGSPAGYTLEYRVYRSDAAFDANFNPATTAAIATVNSSDPLEHIDTGSLTAGTEYFYRVYAVGVKSGSPTLFSDFSANNETTKPELAAITTLKAVNTTGNNKSREVELSWDKAANITGYTISYILYRSTDETFPTNLTDIINVAQPANGNTVEVVEKSTKLTGGALTPATKFFYKVVAVATRDANFKPQSPDSNVVDAIVDIPQPTGLTIELNAQNKALLTWDNWAAPAGYDVKYLVYYSTTDTQNNSFTYISPDVAQNNAQAATTTGYTHSATPNQGVVYYRIFRKVVKSTDANYRLTSYDYSNIVEVMVAPPAPTNLEADENSAGNINLTWTEPTIPTGYTVNYRIYRKTGSALYDFNTPLATVAGGTATYIDTSFDSDNDTVNDSHKRYYYTIKTEVTKNGVTTLGPKATDDADLLHNPLAPATVTVGEVDDNGKKVQLSWSAVAKPQGFAVKYHIYRKVGTAANYNFAAAPLATVNGPVTNYIDSSAQSNKHNCYTIRTEVTKGTVGSKGQVESTEADIFYNPAAPATVSVSENANNNIELSWQANNAITNTGYKVKYLIFRKKANDANYPATATYQVTEVNGVTPTTYEDVAAAANTCYSYIIKTVALYSDGTLSSIGQSDSNPVEIFYNPTAPADLTIGINNNDKVELNWTANSTVTGDGYNLIYYIYRSNSSGGYNFTANPLATIPVSNANAPIKYVDNVASPDSQYFYVVKAEAQKSSISSVSSGQSNEVDAFYNPSAPTDLTATINSTTEVTLNWTAPTFTIPNGYSVEYRVFRSVGNNSTYGAAPLNQSAITGTTFTDSTVGGTTTYYYKVYTTMKKSDNSLTVKGTAASNEIVIDTTPPAPTGLEVVADNITSSQIIISWTPVTTVAGNNIEYKVERSTVADNFTNIVDTLTGAVNPNGGSGKMEYIDSALQANTAYRYRVYTVLKKGATTVNTSAASAIIDETTLLETPTAPSATYDSGTNQITLSWTAVTGADSYTIEISSNNTQAGPYIPLSSNITTTTHIDPTTVPATGTTTYYYTIVAVTAGGNTSAAASTHVTVTIP